MLAGEIPNGGERRVDSGGTDDRRSKQHQPRRVSLSAKINERGEKMEANIARMHGPNASAKRFAARAAMAISSECPMMVAHGSSNEN